MVTRDEKLQQYMEVIQRILPDLVEQDESLPEALLQEVLAIEQEGEAELLLPPAYAALPELPSLPSILKRIGPLPPYSAVIGLCQDGLPFLIDFSDPAPGCVLITGNAHSGKTQLTSAILYSASQLNHPREFTFSVITPEPSRYDFLSRLRHAEQVISSYNRAAAEHIIAKATLAEQRRNARQLGAVHVIAIDDLASLLKYKEYETYTYLKWLLEQGPKAGIWVIATLEGKDEAVIDETLFQAFGTFLIGPESRPRATLFTASFPRPLTTIIWTIQLKTWKRLDPVLDSRYWLNLSRFTYWWFFGNCCGSRGMWGCFAGAACKTPPHLAPTTENPKEPCWFSRQVARLEKKAVLFL